MKKYITNSGLQEETAAMKLLRNVFKSPKKEEDKEKESDPPDDHH